MYFYFSDGRRCRTPRTANHSHFCFDHAQKEARATETLGKELAYFFSADYLSACDLSAALARLIPAVVRGDIKPRTARTVAYPAQTLLQSIRLAQHEYINAFAPTAGATPSAIPSTATTTTSTHPSLPLNPKAKRDSSTAQADHLAGARWEEKASACFARNDSSGVCGACRS
jgi:hypothetical protein